MAIVEKTPAALTLDDLAKLFGDMPAWRIRNAPAPGTATEDDVIEIEEREDRLCLARLLRAAERIVCRGGNGRSPRAKEKAIDVGNR